MNAVLENILWLTLGGTALGLVLMGLRRVMKDRLPSAFYYYAYLVVLVRLILPLPGLIPVSDAGETASGQSPVEMSAAEPVLRTYRNDYAQTYANADNAAQPGIEAEPVAKWESEAAPAAETESEYAQKQPGGHFAPGELLRSGRFWLCLWAVGAAGSMVWYIAGYRRFLRALRRTMSDPAAGDVLEMERLAPGGRPAICRSSGVDTPMLMGFLHPTVVLPDREYSPLELRGVLSHELTHYRRGDIAYKWFSILVFCLHWFNPAIYLFRQELDRICELSCDECLLRRMSTEEKRQYGNTLLALAESRTLPGCVIATTFATEKRCLKERLEQIMKYKNSGKRWLLPVLMGMLVILACGAAFGPASADISSEPAASDEAVHVGAEVDMENAVRVSTVDEFLAAIAPDTTVYLEPGLYDLSDAANYGKLTDSPYYAWGEEHDGKELVIKNVENFAIVGAAREQATISAEPRYADVITFRNCAGITLSSLTAGHTEESGQCAGGVIHLENTNNVNVSDCILYGCGILGIQSVNCRTVLAQDTIIYDCSNGAVWAQSSYDVRLRDCSVYECEGELFRVLNSEGFALIDCAVYDNAANTLLETNSREVYLLGTRVADNAFGSGMLTMAWHSAVVEGCVFENNDGAVYSDAVWLMDSEELLPALSMEGERLDEAALLEMELASVPYTGPVALEPVKLNKTVTDDGMTEVHVSTVDELLAAIAPNTTIYLEKGEYNLSKASDFNTYGSEYYYWYSANSELVISGVTNLHIVGKRASETIISTEPRGANVLVFSGCEDIELSDITAGHTEEPGSCTGGVLRFVDTNAVVVNYCRLYGCGILGVQTSSCRDIEVSDTEIYDCSDGAARIYDSENVAFNNCNIHDCGQPLFGVYESKNVTRDGEAL